MPLMSDGFVSGERFRGRAELHERVARAAAALQRLGIGSGDCVAILMRNDLAFLETSYAAMRLGAYAVPINWHFRGPEVAYILADCAARVLVGHADLLAGIAGHLPASVTVVSVKPPPEVVAAYRLSSVETRLPDGAAEYEDWIGREDPDEGPAATATQSIIYTSGTTGRPKGVRRPVPTPAHAAEIARLRELAYGIKPGIRTVVAGPLYHSAPNSFGLRAGPVCDLLVLMPRFEPEAFLRIVERERIDTVFLVPTMFIRLLKLPDEVRSAYDVSSLRFVIHAAAPCPPEVKRAMIDWWGPIINEFYGGTESGPVTFATTADALAKPGTVGRAAPGAQIRILDDEGAVLPRGQVGEVFSRIEAYADFTYQNAPEQRAAIERDGFITCGDVGYLDEDGYLFVCDRKRDMIISGGVNIYPAEIEAAIHALPGVRDCAVFGVPDPEYGESVVAVVEPLDGATLDPAAMRDALAREIAAYKVPRTIEIRHDLPREDSGKIFKRKLRDAIWSGAGRAI
jgi:long-chain acyl-CoA synthetase